MALHVDFGLAGPITLDAFSIQLIGPSPSPLSPFDVPFTGIISLSGLIGPAGTVSLSGDSLFVANSTVSSSTGGAGDGGNVLVTASGPVVLEGASATRRTARPGARGGRTLASFGVVGRGGLPLLSVLASYWTGALGAAEKLGDATGRIDILARRAEAHRTLGYLNRSLTDLKAAIRGGGCRGLATQRPRHRLYAVGRAGYAAFLQLADIQRRTG